MAVTLGLLLMQRPGDHSLSTALGVIAAHAGAGALAAALLARRPIEDGWARATIYGIAVGAGAPLAYISYLVATRPGSILVFGAIIVTFVVWVVVGLLPWILIGRLWVALADRGT